MRILCFNSEKYPARQSGGYVLLHQSMALESMGHDVHIFTLGKTSTHLADYLDAYEFELIYLDMAFLQDTGLRALMQNYRSRAAVWMVGALHALPEPDRQAWELVDFVTTPWKGARIDRLSREWDLRYLPLGYNAELHRRMGSPETLGPVYVGNAGIADKSDTGSALRTLVAEGVVLGIGPAFEKKYVDPFMLARVYSAARCLPNFHHAGEKGDDCMLNERFWQSARCGIPVNDFSPIMTEILEPSLVDAFCFDGVRDWQDRIRMLQTGADAISATLIEKLEHSMLGHSYTDRMKQLIDWVAATGPEASALSAPVFGESKSTGGCEKVSSRE